MANFLGLFLVLVVGSALGIVISCCDLAWAAARRRTDPPVTYAARFWAELRFVFRFDQSVKPLQVHLTRKPACPCPKPESFKLHPVSGPSDQTGEWIDRAAVRRCRARSPRGWSRGGGRGGGGGVAGGAVGLCCGRAQALLHAYGQRPARASRRPHDPPSVRTRPRSPPNPHSLRTPSHKALMQHAFSIHALIDPQPVTYFMFDVLTENVVRTMIDLSRGDTLAYRICREWYAIRKNRVNIIIYKTGYESNKLPK